MTMMNTRKIKEGRNKTMQRKSTTAATRKQRLLVNHAYRNKTKRGRGGGVCAAENEDASSSPTPTATTTTTAVKEEKKKTTATTTTKKKAAVIAGMDTSRGVFGFNPFSELWVGRWAMIGFASGLTVELVTGKGILRQVGIDTPSTPVLVGLSAFIGGATLLGSGVTVARLMTGKMTDEEVADYAFFLGLKGERSATKKSSAEMKKKGDFTSLQELDDVDDAANAMKTKTAEPELLPEEEDIDSYLARSEMAEAAYAKGVELNNGRCVDNLCHDPALRFFDYSYYSFAFRTVVVH